MPANYAWLNRRWLIVAAALGPLLMNAPVAGAVPASSFLSVASGQRAYARLAAELGAGRVRSSVWSHWLPAHNDCPASATIIIYSGEHGEPSRKRLRSHCPKAKLLIRVRDFLPKGSRLHDALWYEPSVVPRLANVIAAEFMRLDPAHRQTYVRSLGHLMQALQPAYSLWAKIVGQTRGWHVVALGNPSATLARALHVQVSSASKQMLSLEPPTAVLYDKGLSANQATFLRQAQHVGIPTIAIANGPSGRDTYSSWIHRQLKGLLRAVRRVNEHNDNPAKG